MVMIAHRLGGKLLWANDSVAARNVIEMMPPKDRRHPNEKPIDFVLHFIRLHSRRNSIIIDPFMGSGTTGVACVKLGRRFVGIEIEERYFDIACRRIEEAYRQPDMFIEPPAKPVQETLL